MVDQVGAIGMFVPDIWTFDGTDATWLVLHKTAGFSTAQECAAYFQAGSDGRHVSAHYVVGQDGAIVQCVLESRGAGANCCTEAGHASYLPTDINLNVKTISIEHIDPSADNSTPLTAAQAAASFQLVHDICVRHNIPMRPGDGSGGIIGHNDIAPESRARCPGNYPWNDLWSFLGEATMIDITTPGVSTFFKQDTSGAWICLKNNNVIHGGILTFYKSFGPGLCGLTNLGLPESNEINLNLTNHPEVVIQRFERGIVAYDPHHVVDSPPGAGEVYLAHHAPDASQIQAQLDAAQKKLDQIKQLAS